MAISIRISATIDNEYANRLPDFLPLDKLNVGICIVTLDEARAVLADAEYNSDRQAVDVGPYGTPLHVFNAYRALAKQVRETVAAEVPGEVLGVKCLDGGACHHKCTDTCFRRECCVPFSDYIGPWKYES